MCGGREESRFPSSCWPPFRGREATPSVGTLKSLDGRRARKYPENSEAEVPACAVPAPFCSDAASRGAAGEREGGGCASVLDGDRVHAYGGTCPK